MLQTEQDGLSVGLSVTTVSLAKTAEPIEMSFGVRNQVGPRNHVLDGGPGPDALREGAILMVKTKRNRART